MATLILSKIKNFTSDLDINTILDFIWRNITWIVVGLSAILLINPSMPEIRTLLFIIVIEAIAIGLSGMAVMIYTKINFLKSENYIILGQIFIGVHILVGIAVLGIYIAQFGI